MPQSLTVLGMMNPLAQNSLSCVKSRLPLATRLKSGIRKCSEYVRTGSMPL